MPREITVTLDGTEHTITERRSKDNAQYRARLQEEVSSLRGLLDGDLSSGDGLASLIDTIAGALFGSVDTIRDLVLEYAPNLAEPMEGAYDSEIVEVFKAILGLVFPFGVGGLVGQIQGLIQAGMEQNAKKTTS